MYKNRSTTWVCFFVGFVFIGLKLDTVVALIILITRTTYLIILFLPNSLNIPFFKFTRSFYLAERVFYWL